MRLKSEIERDTGVPVKIRTGGLGALDVYVDGKQVFSKKSAGRLPRADELVAAIRAT